MTKNTGEKSSEGGVFIEDIAVDDFAERVV
jgi:hypothetical protein